MRSRLETFTWADSLATYEYTLLIKPIKLSKQKTYPFYYREAEDEEESDDDEEDEAATKQEEAKSSPSKEAEPETEA